MRPLLVSAKRAAELSPDALGPWFGLEFLLLAAFLLPVFRYGGDRLRRALPVLMAAALVLSQAVFAAFAWKDFAGQIPWSSDHSSFLFRLHEVRATFPRLGGYNPWWNGGTEHFISVTSGTHGYAVLVAPLLALFEPHVFHAPVLFFWIWIGFPWLGALCVRSAGARWTAALSTAMALEAWSRAQFLFAWHYGILGGLVTAGLATPLAALGYRLAVQRRGGWRTVAAVGATAWLSCLWTPGYATCAGLALGALANADRWTRRSFLRLLAAAAVALALLAPWAWVTLGPAHGIVAFASAGRDALPFFRTLGHGLLLLLNCLLEWHPVLVAFGVAGLALSVLSGATVHPLSRGLAPLRDKPFVALARSLEASDPGRWIANTSTTGNFLLAQGLDCIAGAQAYAVPAMWDRLDPSGADRSEWDRYAHVIVELGPEGCPLSAKAPNADHLRYTLDESRLRALGVRHVVWTGKKLHEPWLRYEGRVRLHFFYTVLPPGASAAH